jgi:DNA-binding XRE family transcriptional regulator
MDKRIRASQQLRITAHFLRRKTAKHVGVSSKDLLKFLSLKME